MRILPLVNYYNDKSYIVTPSFKQNNNAISGSNNLKSANEIAKRTSEPNLSTYINLMGNKMNVDANIKFFTTALCRIDTDTKRKHEPLEIADIGCCDGALCRKLDEFLPSNTKFYGLDLSKDMLDKAVEKDKAINRKNTCYEVGNAFNLPYKRESKDAIILSSIMHELYSYPSEEYGEDAYSKDSVLHFMEKAYDSLKPGGVLIIKDPATPEIDALEPIVIKNANKLDGEYSVIEDEQDLKNANITKLSTYDKLRRFCTDFYPARNNIKWNKDGDCIMPRWLVTEWVRHRKWLRTPENWDYEIKENYGTLKPDEISEFAKRTGFSIVKVENISIPNSTNFYKINDGEFELEDLQGNKLSLEDFPMFIEAVLRKPRI